MAIVLLDVELGDLLRACDPPWHRPRHLPDRAVLGEVHEARLANDAELADLLRLRARARRPRTGQPTARTEDGTDGPRGLPVGIDARAVRSQELIEDAEVRAQVAELLPRVEKVVEARSQDLGRVVVREVHDRPP